MVRPHRHTTGCAWALLSSSPCTSVEIQAGRAAAAQPSPGEHSPAHMRGSSGPGHSPTAGKKAEMAH